MALSQLYSAVAGAVITAARWNNEFGNIYTNGTDISFPTTKAVSFAGFTVTFDASGFSTISSPSSSGFLFTVGSKTGAPGINGSLATIAASTFTDSSTAISGTASLWTGFSVRTPTVAATATGVQTTIAATVYVEGAPIAGANETIKAPYAFYAASGMIGAAAGSDIASASSIAVTAPFTVVTGTTTITAISTVYPAGTMFKLKFSGTGLNITYNATSMISPWALDYRTVPNEILEFISLGSGNYQFYSLNGPKERTGTTIEANSSSTPAGFLPEDGTSLLRATYPGLFAEIGTTFGTVDGTHFTAPLTLGLVVINRDPANSIITVASTNGANAATLGGKGGAQTHTLTEAQLAAHDHNTVPTAGGGGVLTLATHLANQTGGAATADPINNAGGGSAHNNTQPWIAKAKYIRF